MFDETFQKLIETYGADLINSFVTFRQSMVTECIYIGMKITFRLAYFVDFEIRTCIEIVSLFSGS